MKKSRLSAALKACITTVVLGCLVIGCFMALRLNLFTENKAGYLTEDDIPHIVSLLSLALEERDETIAKLRAQIRSLDSKVEENTKANSIILSRLNSEAQALDQVLDSKSRAIDDYASAFSRMSADLQEMRALQQRHTQYFAALFGAVGASESSLGGTGSRAAPQSAPPVPPKETPASDSLQAMPFPDRF